MYYQNPKPGVESHRMLISPLPPICLYIMPVMYKSLSIRFSEATIGIVDRVLQTQFKFHMLTFGTEIVILYIAEECVRLRPTPPPAGYFLYYAQDQVQGYTPIIHLKKCVGILYIVCAMVCIL